MANNPLSNLAAALTRDAGAPILLTRDYLIAGLADASVSVSTSLDSDLKAAFQSTVAGLSINLTAQSVQPLNPTSQTFKVTGVSARFLQQDVKQGLVLTFGLRGSVGAQSLSLEIVTTPASWGWSDLSTFATGIPFKWAGISNAVFTFNDSLGPCQGFAANLTPPNQLSNAVAVVQNLGFPTLALPFTGSMDFAKVDGVDIFMPTTTLQAPFLGPDSGLKLLYLSVDVPVFGLIIGPPELQDGDDPAEAFYDQQVSLYFGLDLSLTDQRGQSIDYQMRALAQINNGSAFNFYLGHSDDGSALLTPATIIGLLDNNGSFFTGTPPVLQQFLSGIGLRSLSLSGATSPSLALSSASVTLGADPTVINIEHPWVPLQDPTNQLVFGVTDFELVWGINFLPKGSAQSFLFQTQFLLLPEVFKGKTVAENGLFFVQFNSDLQLLARFDGTANLNDLIATLTLDLIRIPKGFVDASLSDVGLSLDVGAKSYAFNAGFELDLNLFTLGGQPILSVTDGQLYIKATTPPSANGVANTPPVTTYQAGIGGLVGIGPYFANVNVDYDGTQTPATWKVAARLAQPVDVQQLVSQFLSFGGAFTFPDFLPGTLLVNTLEVDASLATGATPIDRYTVAGSLRWTFNLGQAFSVDTLATLSLSYDASKPAQQQYSGSATTLWDFSFLNDSVLLGYSFAPDNQGSNAQLSLSWEGLTAIYQVDKKTLTFTLKNWSLGRLIQKLMQSLGDPYFTLDSPWDVLNQISLDGLSLIISLETSNDSTPTIAAKYTLASKIDLGFMSIDGLVFERKKVDGVDKITLGIDGSSVFKGNNPQEQQDWSNLLDPQKGQPVDKLPSVPGQGTDYFSLPLLVLGQRVAISGYDSFANTKAVIDALKKVPSTTGSSNPLNPGDSGTKGTPYYNRNSDWLIAGQLLLLKTGKDWTVDLMLVFNDPNLYGLRLALAGEKAKALGNLVLDILYKKITDDVGVYQIEWTFPDSIRNLNFGAVSIVLPEIGVKIYTNGDFFIDIGFPYNLDFTRSFSISAIVYGVPVLGAGGFYLGKLSSVTATQVPKTTQGTFDPVIVFGLGLQLGLGYNFVKGPLKAGFALTVFGILEGTIAAFHAYRPSTALVTANSSVQDDYYFKIQGTVGVIGLLYGSIDFAIISAAVNVRITLSLSLTYESYKPIPIAARATVEVSVKVKIDLGLFSFSISFSFHADVSARFEINALNSGPAPWAEPTLQLARQARHLQLANQRRATTPKAMSVSRSTTKPVLNLYATPQFTVMCNEGVSSYSGQLGAFVFLLTMDAPSPTQQTRQTDGSSSFERLCADYLPWLIGTLGSASSDQDTLADILGTLVDKALLEVDIERLADLANPPFGISELLTFLSSFDVSITLPDATNQAQIKQVLEAGSVLFPVFDGLSLEVPLANAGSTTLDFLQYVGTNSTYRSNVAQLFKELAAVVTAKDDSHPPALRATGDDNESMAAVIFTDAFMVIGRQLLQVALNAFDDYAYATANGNSIKQILQWTNDARGNSLTLDDLVRPNAEVALTAGLTLDIPLSAYTLQSSDTLATVARAWSDSAAPARWTTTAPGLILANGNSTVIAANQLISLLVGNDIHQYTTGPGETFNSLARALGVDLPVLAQDSALYDMAGLLLPGQPLLLPTLAYQTAAGDSLNSSGARFGVSAMALFSDPLSGNFSVGPLFATPQITLTALNSLFTEDLWSVVVGTDQLAQLAGMLSRFLAYGLRLPSNPAGMGGLSLSAEFLYPNNQSAYGLYQLTGQQFPTPTDQVPGTDFPISLSRAASSHGVDLSFVQIAGGSNGSMNLNQAYSNLSVVLAYAQQGKFQPAPSISLLPTVARSPKDYAVKSVSLWSTADLQQLRDLCQPGLRASTEEAPSVQPMLWSLPDGLVRLINQRVGSLATQLPDLSQQLPYLLAFTPCEVSTDPATLETTHREIASYSYATRVDFTIKRLPQAEPGVIASSGSSVSYTYQLLGPSATDAQLLERLLSAVDELGTSIISGQFLLMPQGNAKASNLLSQAQSDFLAFLTQTNLSTETNPPPDLMTPRMADDAGPRGILNPPQEVVKLLWELSTVRSGGYYLSYYDVIASSGLPDGIFDDSGTATLTLVVTYPREALLGRLCNFINAFVTTDTVIQQGSHMTLRSASTVNPSQPTRVSDSLESLATFYGIGAGRIAELNPGATLTTHAQVPIDGIIHLVTPADSSAGNGQPAAILDNLARYYSVGALQPLTAAQIAALNPGVSAASSVALFIPALVYLVDGSLAPGNSLQSLADYYNLDLDALAVGAERVPGLLVSGSTLTLDTRTFDLQAVFNQGNAAFSVLRDNPPPVDSPSVDPDGYASAYLYNLYSVLSAGIDGSPWFSASDLALPFGPQRPDSGADELEAQIHRRAMRNPQSRREALDALADESQYNYQQTLGLARRATSNAAPQPTNPGLPAAADNPYRGVGSFAQVNLSWLDIFGNITVTPFQQPPAGYSGSLNHPPLPLRYNDRLIALSAWPNTRSFYTYEAAAGGAQLVISLSLDTSSYDPASGGDIKVQAGKDLEMFSLIYYQLNQSYQGLNLPWCQGRAVSVELVNSLFAQPLSRLDDSQSQPLLDYINGVILYLGQVVLGATATPPATVRLCLAVDIDSLAPGSILPLSLTLSLRRVSTLVAPDVAGLEGGVAVTSTLLPVPDPQAASTSGYNLFAATFEALFQRSGAWLTRVGSGTADPGSTPDGRSQTLWAARFALQDGAVGIRYRIDPAPGYFAARPIANSLTSDSVQIAPTYRPDQPFPGNDLATLNLTGVDQNLWFETALKAIDGFLSPTYAPSVFLLDTLLGSKDPLKDGNLGKILSAKQTLADDIASTIEPVLSTGPQDGETRAAAGEKLRQTLLNQLYSAYSTTAIVGFSVQGNATDQTLSLYGQPTVSGSSQSTPGTGNNNYAFGSGRIGLQASAGESALAFVFNSRNEAARSYVPLELELQISHLEHDMRSVPGISGYTQSNWISLIGGPLRIPLAGGQTMNLPVLLRALPEPPTIQGQTATAWVQPPQSASDLSKWTYAFESLFRGTAQDSLNVAIALNTPTLDGALRSTGKSLVTALAQFVTVYPSIEVAMQQSLTGIDVSQPTELQIAEAQHAVAAFVYIVQEVTDAYHAWASPILSKTAFVPPQALTCAFSQVLAPVTVAGQEVAETLLLDVTINDVAASYDPGTGRISATLAQLGEVSLPAPRVEIDPTQYEAVSVVDPDNPGLIAYRYQLKDVLPVQWLDYEQALLVNERRTSLPALNVFDHQDAWASLSVERNRILFPAADIGTLQTNPLFRFSTPIVRFADSISPHITQGSFSLDTLTVANASLDDYLKVFFAALGSGSNGTTVQVGMEGRYSYDIAGQGVVARTVLPAALMLPVATSLNSPPAFTNAFSQAIDRWRLAEQVTVQGNARVDLTLRAFSADDPAQLALGALASDNQPPLLSIENLWVSASKVPPGQGGL
ncbi:hypothetical protein PHLH3_25210 [Pseudomonas sp. St386]|uniref:hypothetical protein n=1 Tax=Pseudomonas sp. St386 TaxID=2678256 RepID=UPI001BB3ED3B|nr:hypothetical protein [Pseudomonas sp. St386]BBP52895.1 hypothetical protein PHLH3_25210 [Pseudomonas sp. St386]